MNKRSQTKFVFSFIIFILIFGVSLLVVGDTQPETGTVSIDIDSKPGNGWTTSPTLYINVTPQITGDFGRSFGGWGNGSSFDMNISYTWGFGNQSGEFFENQTINYLAVPNGTTVQFNITELGEDGKFSYYITAYNWSEGPGTNYVNSSNISVRSSTHNFWVDSTNPVATLNWPLAYTNTAGNFTTNSIKFNVTVIETNPILGYLYTNESGVYMLNHTFVYTNNTESGEILIDNFPSGYITYFWNFTDIAGNMAYSANRTFFVDETAPTISTITENNSWSTTSATIIQANVTEAFKGGCELWGNFTSSGDTTFRLNQTNSSFISGEHVSFMVSVADTTYPTPYRYNITCFDSSGTPASLVGRAINVDTVAPPPANLTLLRGMRSTDHTPNITHDPSVENNFLVYSLNFYEAGGDWYGQTNSSNNNSHGIVFTTPLGSDTNYTYNITTIDRAGNIGQTEIYNASMDYMTDSTCWNQSEGYNFCGIIRNGFTEMGQIANETKAQYVYKWNGTWVIFATGSITNYHINFTRGEVAVVYINSTGPYEWEDRVWPYNYTVINTNMSANSSVIGSGYHLMSIHNMSGINFTNYETSFQKQNWTDMIGGTPQVDNTSIQRLAYINNSVLGDIYNDQQYFSWKFEKGYNNFITMDYGEAVWAYNGNYTVKGLNVYFNRSLGGFG